MIETVNNDSSYNMIMGVIVNKISMYACLTNALVFLKIMQKIPLKKNEESYFYSNFST